uniref:Phytanoyl-CoA dioxygenase n=1 Tax=Chromera velia CCMP2878 TaxID=1169474 RepID=A0A0G4I597_9ALVE|eukprot:Cvel_11125.t1-p1 / transcript=Cvel_11125.t1 / gene=Cvel_11125 / organism=Chromera_velia_CCMP2878 / gene_product=hypothetical protein / transcript_product=hypothetical protein / location=Cvel_scaffold689:26376-30738(-) / protein_length=478 / sequence_SO=supercontig / SO=protein_coding / is_pseudo=false
MSGVRKRKGGGGGDGGAAVKTSDRIGGKKKSPLSMIFGVLFAVGAAAALLMFFQKNRGSGSGRRQVVVKDLQELRRLWSDPGKIPETLKTKLLCYQYCSDGEMVNEEQSEAFKKSVSKENPQMYMEAAAADELDQLVLAQCAAFCEMAADGRLPGVSMRHPFANVIMKQMQFNGSTAEVKELPSEIDEYLECAAECTNITRLTFDMKEDPTEDQILDTLERCGLVQLVNAFPKDVAKQISEALDKYEKIGKVGNVPVKYFRNDNLYNKRYEMWLPHEEPFLRLSKIVGPESKLAKVINGYLLEGETTQMDYASAIFAPALSTGAQPLHRDTVDSLRSERGTRETLNMQVAIMDVDQSMGPTVFCPCSQLYLNFGENPAHDALEEFFWRSADPKCLDLTQFTRAFTPTGAVTLYDGVTVHAGTANESPRNRTVMNLSFAASDSMRSNDAYDKLMSSYAKKHVDAFRLEFGDQVFAKMGS